MFLFRFDLPLGLPFVSSGKCYLDKSILEILTAMIRFLTFPFLLLTSQILFSQTPEEIIARAEELLHGETSQGTFEMTVTTPEFSRTMSMDSWWSDKEDKSLIVVNAPPKEAGNKWLKIGNEMWNYLRATETVIKIPPSMMLQSWNGSDFTNDDLVRESSVSRDYNPQLVGIELVRGDSCYKFLLDPKPDAAVVWGKLYYWVRKADLLPSIVQFYYEKGTLIRYMVYSDIKNIGGRTIPTTWSVFNSLKEGHRTDFKILRIEFDIVLSDRLFSFRELERGGRR